jgi:hypothetical protein
MTQAVVEVAPLWIAMHGHLMVRKKVMRAWRG